jgi:hypothetical protein
VPRIRSIKPEINEDEVVGQLSDGAYRLYIGLITQADDDGRHLGHLTLVRSKVFPWDGERDLGGIATALDDLHDGDLIVAYEVDGKPYIQIQNWTKHQSIDKRWYKPSKLPEPPDVVSPRPPRGHDEDPPRPDADRDETATPEWSGVDRSGEDGIGGVAPTGGRDAAATPIPPFAPIVQRLDAVAVAHGKPSPKVDAALQVCTDYAARDLAADIEEFVHYWTDGPGARKSCDDVVWRWRLWLKRATAADDKPKSGNARSSVSEDLARLEAQHAEALAEEARS